MSGNLISFIPQMFSFISPINSLPIVLLFLLFQISTYIFNSDNILHIINNPFDFKKVSNKNLKNDLNETVNNPSTVYIDENLKQDFEDTYKSLSDLPTREEFIAYFNRIKQKSDLNRLSVFIIDLDRFRTINELYGRSFGNNIIIQVANRINKLIGRKVMIAREGEDELLFLIDNLSVTEMRKTGSNIIDSFVKPFKVGEKSVYITASIGISHYPSTSEDAEELLQQAEIAMYSVKRSGRNNHHLFMPEDAVEIERKRRIEFGLKESLINNELYLLYQPKVKIETGEIYGVESLLRWQHPVLGLVNPVEFIPIAEESGIIFEIGYWVIYEAARQTKEWHRKGISIQNAVNVSALQFKDPYFVTRLKHVLEKFSLEPKYLIIEITESVMKNVEESSKVIKELHVLGVSVAIDDFGTGYSSLSVLNNVFIDIVKIDKSFIDDVGTKENTASLVKTIIQMGKSLDFKIVAEGIENDCQRSFLSVHDCEFGQGYYYSKPILEEEVIDLVMSTRELGEV